MADHLYSNTASVAQLNAAINPSDTTVVLAGGTFSGYPAAPFWGILDRATATAELVEVTNVASNTLTVVRAQGGTSAQSHGAGATFEHVAPAIVFQNSEAHISASTGVHGVSGSVVGTTGNQTIQDKTFRGAHRAVFSDALPAGVTASFESTADSASARDGFVHNNTAADVDRRGFLLAQSGTPRFEVFNDGTVKNTPAGGATRKGIETTTSLKAGTTLEVGGASTLTGNTTVGGTLGVTGATTLSTVSTSGAATLNSVGVTNNATVGGTLGVTGATTLAAASATTVTASGLITAAAGVKSFGSTLPDVTVVTSLGTIASPVTDQVVFLTTDRSFYIRTSAPAWERVTARGKLGVLSPTADFTTLSGSEQIVDTLTFNALSGISWKASYCSRFSFNTTGVVIIKFRLASGASVALSDTEISSKIWQGSGSNNSNSLFKSVVAASSGQWTIGVTAQLGGGASSGTLYGSVFGTERELLVEAIG